MRGSNSRLHWRTTTTSRRSRRRERASVRPRHCPLAAGRRGYARSGSTPRASSTAHPPGGLQLHEAGHGVVADAPGWTVLCVTIEDTGRSAAVPAGRAARQQTGRRRALERVCRREVRRRCRSASSASPPARPNPERPTFTGKSKVASREGEPSGYAALGRACTPRRRRSTPADAYRDGAQTVAARSSSDRSRPRRQRSAALVGVTGATIERVAACSPGRRTRRRHGDREVDRTLLSDNSTRGTSECTARPHTPETRRRPRDATPQQQQAPQEQRRLSIRIRQA